MNVAPEKLTWKIEDNQHIKAFFHYRADIKGYIELQSVSISENEPHFVIIYVYDSIRCAGQISVAKEDKDAINNEIVRLITQIYEKHTHHSYRLYDLMTSNI